MRRRGPGPLRVRGLSRSFAGHVVLREVDLDVPAGQVHAVSGRSGSGKTTLLRIIAGLEKADAGDVGWAAPLAYVGTEDDLRAERNVAANIALALPGRERSTRAGAAEVAGLLDLVGLATEIADRTPRELSAGERQRVALARALAERPATLLLDEPFAAVDPTTRLRLLADVGARLRSSSVAALLVTHDPGEAAWLADRWWLLASGRLHAQSP